jgi:hypothetical protein
MILECKEVKQYLKRFYQSIVNHLGPSNTLSFSEDLDLEKW